MFTKFRGYFKRNYAGNSMNNEYLNATPMKLLETDILSDDEKEKDGEKINFYKAKSEEHTEDGVMKRDTWDSKIDFLLSVIGFSVDLGNVWRFPYICFKNGGGAFLFPYIIMYIFGGLPLFFLELALGQYQRSGCLTVWRRICPMFRGIGYGIIVIAMYTSWYYNTIMAWALYYLVESLEPNLPWMSCGNIWNTNNCVTVEQKNGSSMTRSVLYSDLWDNGTWNNRTVNESLYSSTEEYFYRRVLDFRDDTDFNNMGPIKGDVVLALAVVFLIVFFALRKGVKSSGKAVWVTATLPYIILIILLIRGVQLDGSMEGIKFYLRPNKTKLWETQVWTDAAAQIFFSLGPGFGVLLALSSYNRFRNNCYRDALVTSAINCFTSFIAGFVVFSVLGHMCVKLGKSIDDVADQQAGLVFIAYPEAISTLTGSTFWSIIFFIMLISLGLDSTFGGLEAVITGVLDEWPRLRKHRQVFVFGLICCCFIGSLATTTRGGFLLLNWLDMHGAPISILFIVFCECVALCWFYGIKRFSSDVEQMLGFKPPSFYRMSWCVISPIFLLTIFLVNVYSYTTVPIEVMRKPINPPGWMKFMAFMVVMSSIINIPIFMLITFLKTRGTMKQRWQQMIQPEIRNPDDLNLPLNDTKQQYVDNTKSSQAIITETCAMANVNPVIFLENQLNLPGASMEQYTQQQPDNMTNQTNLHHTIHMSHTDNFEITPNTNHQPGNMKHIDQENDSV